MRQNERCKKVDSRQLKVERKEKSTAETQRTQSSERRTRDAGSGAKRCAISVRLKKNAGKMPALPRVSGRRVFGVVRNSARLAALRWTRLLRWRACRRVSVSPWRRQDFRRAARVLWCRGWEPSTVSGQGSTRERFARSSRFSLSRNG